MRKLEEESEVALEKYNEISEAWSSIVESVDPLDIESGMKAQKERCDDLVTQKDKIIKELREELQRADERFAIDQQIQVCLNNF